MIRLKLVAIIGGLLLSYHGYQELTLAKLSTAEPAKVDVAAVERGDKVTNPHVLLGEHLRLYGDAIYSYSRKKHESGPPNVTTRVTTVYYPVISHQHPFLKQIEEMRAKYPDLKKLPPGVKPPSLDTVSVIVKTKRFATVGSIPSKFEVSKDLTGLAVNLIESLKEKERQLIRSTFPKVDFDTLLIVEEDRHPKTTAYGMGVMAAGILLSLIALIWLIKGGRSQSM